MNDFELYPTMMWMLLAATLSTVLVAAAVPLVAALAPTSLEANDG